MARTLPIRPRNGPATCSLARRPAQRSACSSLPAIALAVAGSLRRAHGSTRQALRDIATDRTEYPLRAALRHRGVLCLLCGVVIALMSHYHVFGTDRTGNDVLLQALKSVRTAFVIGTIATIATLPFAVVLGVLAGYFKGWVDEVIQYLYTTLTSVPNVLLIAACVLMVQVFLDKHPELFETGVERSDLKMFLLCVILGLTGWATALPPGARRDAEAARARIRAGRHRVRRQPCAHHGAPHRAQRDASGADHDGAELLRPDPRTKRCSPTSASASIRR